MSITNIPKNTRILVIGSALAAVSLIAFGQQRTEAQIPAESTSARQMTQAAIAFLASLDETQRDGIMYAVSYTHLTLPTICSV